jgi:hypothetical protein
VWETSSKPDTYYSCSALVFPAAAKATTTAGAPAVVKSTPSASVKPAPASTKATATPKVTTKPAAAAVPVAATTPPVALTPVSDESSITLGHQIVAGAVLLGVAAVLWAIVDRLRRRRRENG